MSSRPETKFYINLQVADIERSVRFFSSLGFSFDPVFTTEMSACMYVSDEVCVNLLDPDAFSRFTPKPVVDAANATEVVVTLKAPTREHVDAMVVEAINLGGTPALPTQDLGAIYGRSFQDLDGHIWEVMTMDLVAFREQIANSGPPNSSPEA